MCRRRWTFLSVLVFLSFNNSRVLTQNAPGTLSATESLQNLKTLQHPNLKPDLLSAAHRLLASQRPAFNDFGAQPFTSKPPVLTVEPSYQQVPVNVNPAPNLGLNLHPPNLNIASPVISSHEVPFFPQVPVNANPASNLALNFLPTTSNIVSPAISSPEISLYQQSPININQSPNLALNFQPTCNTPSAAISLPEIPLETVEVTTPVLEPSLPQPTFEKSSVVYENYVPNYSTSFGEISNAITWPETSYMNNYVQQPEFLQFDQSPVTVQATSFPTVTPLTSFSSPASCNYDQNYFVGSGDFVQPFYPETIYNQQATILPQMETVAVNYGSPAADSGSGYQIPLSLQINMPSPISEPIILVSSPSPTPTPQDQSYLPSFAPMAPPLMVMERSRSKWRNILPILLIALWGGGCCQNSGGCSGGNIPIPYPIPIPTNNPIILNGGR